MPQTDRPGYLRAYEAWASSGRPGLAPSPLTYGLMSGDVLREVCDIDEKLRAESGLSCWQFYAPPKQRAKKPLKGQQPSG